MNELKATKLSQAPSLLEIEQLLFKEALLLDEWRFEEWLDLYSEDCIYWVPSAWGQTDAFNQVSIYYEDKRLLQARVSRLRHPRTETMSPGPRTLHHISNVILENCDVDGECHVYSAMTVIETRLGQQRQFAGHCRHHLRRTGAVWEIVRKRIDLLDCDRDNGFIRMTIPF